MKLDTVRMYKSPEFVGTKFVLVNEKDVEKFRADGWQTTNPNPPTASTTDVTAPTTDTK